ncbi:hypothetical protein B0181_10435 [Moraxella caviae]|uniref:Uncharacterized protein n=1 Tax=Moraxella caviae TaxID=34060 RepID=A0A1S9ZV89_9GAMM|nr:hypothetical protein B0181_10435 [Moraxella caviae]
MVANIVSSYQNLPKARKRHENQMIKCTFHNGVFLANFKQARCGACYEIVKNFTPKFALAGDYCPSF